MEYKLTIYSTMRLLFALVPRYSQYPTYHYEKNDVLKSNYSFRTSKSRKLSSGDIRSAVLFSLVFTDIVNKTGPVTLVLVSGWGSASLAKREKQ